MGLLPLSSAHCFTEVVVEQGLSLQARIQVMLYPDYYTCLNCKSGGARSQPACV